MLEITMLRIHAKLPEMKDDFVLGQLNYIQNSVYNNQKNQTNQRFTFDAMAFIYNIAVSLYSIAIRAAALTGNVKAKQWIEGRKKIFELISSSLKEGERRIWFHCASLGEFEQGRPVIEEFRRHTSTPLSGSTS